MTQSIIGIFDSGIGGLTVVHALSQYMPNASLLYFGDTARFPYGTKSADTIIRYSLENTEFLLKQGAQAIIIACNTATAVALEAVSAYAYPIPVFGVIDAAAQEALQQSPSLRIGIIGTEATIAADSYAKAIRSYNPQAYVISQACPLLASMIEIGCPSEEAFRLIIQAYVQPFHGAIDTLILGCTHYPLRAASIQAELPGISVIDPAIACAQHIAHTISLPPSNQPSLSLFTSADPKRFMRIGKTFLQRPIHHVELALPQNCALSR